MVHLRARNLPAKGILKEWLFKGDQISFGDDVALVELEDGSNLKIKSNYNGVITKTIQLNTPIKNGSIIANIAIGEKEIVKFKNRHYKKGDEEHIEVEDIYISENSDSNLKSIETEADSFSGAVLYDRYNQAVTPFSTGRDDIIDSTEKFEQLEKRGAEMGDLSNPKDRFAQMRANIKDSIKNAPQNKLMGDLSKEEIEKLANKKISEDDGANLFSKENPSGVSKFRQLVQARKEKLLEENNFKEVEEVNQEINAMSKTDEQGRPLIMRNIIQSRIEKLNQSGGDPNVLEKNIVATKENAILDNQKILIEKTNEGKNAMKEKNLEVKQDEVFLRQRPSEDGNFAVSYGGFIEDEEPTVIDANDLNPYGGMVMPQKKPSDIMNEINIKKNKTYADSKISSLYDTKKRWDIIKSRDERNILNERRKAVEKGLKEEHHSLFYKALEKGGIPDEFLREVPYQNPNTGRIQYVAYNQTPKGKAEFESWLKAADLYSAYKDDQEYIEKTAELKNVKNKIFEQEALEPIKEEKNIEETALSQKTSKAIKKEIKEEILKQDKELKEIANKDTALETISFLKEQIDILQKTLKEQNQLNQATSKLNQSSNFNAGTDTFGQMMQYMLMQTMMQNINPKREPSISELKSTIKDEINYFAKELLEKTLREQKENQLLKELEIKSALLKQHDLLEKDLLEKELMHQKIIENKLRESKEFEKQFLQKTESNEQLKENIEKFEKEEEKLKESIKDDLKEINFEEIKPDSRIGYLQFESNDENKIIEREKINKNRNAAVKSMILSQSYIPPLTISTEIDMSSILKLKHMLKQTQNHIKFTTISFIAKAISISLEEYPKLNSSYDPERNEVIIKKYHNIGLATETSEGLIIPVLKFVEKLSIKEVAMDIREMTQRLRAGEIYNYETEGSTITIANYGNIGAIQATPTIFYPNASVIGVGKIVKKPVVVENEKLAIKAIMNISLTVDQRIIDAAEAGRFLAKVKEILEKPEILTVS